MSDKNEVEYVAVIPHYWGVGDTAEMAVVNVLRQGTPDRARLMLFAVPADRKEEGERRWEVSPVDGSVSWEVPEGSRKEDWGLRDAGGTRGALTGALEQTMSWVVKLVGLCAGHESITGGHKMKALETHAERLEERVMDVCGEIEDIASDAES